MCSVKLGRVTQDEGQQPDVFLFLVAGEDFYTEIKRRTFGHCHVTAYGTTGNKVRALNYYLGFRQYSRKSAPSGRFTGLALIICPAALAGFIAAVQLKRRAVCLL